MELIRMKPQIYESILKELKNIYHEAEKIFDIDYNEGTILDKEATTWVKKKRKQM